MANRYIDTTLASGSDDGTTTDDAFQDIVGLTTAMSGDNFIFIRRSSLFTLGSTITIPNSANYPNASNKIVAWPRNSQAFTGTWTQGERVVHSISGITPKLQQHCARNIQNDADGNNYLATAIVVKIVFSAVTQAFAKYEGVTDATSGAIGKVMMWNGSDTIWVVVKSGTFATTNVVNGDGLTQEKASKTAGSGTIDTVTEADGFVIIQDYAGTTEASGNSTIAKDYYYDYCQTNLVGTVDAAWTIKLSTWNADSDDMPIIDGSTNAYRVNFYTYYGRMFNMNVTGGGSNGYGQVYLYGFCTTLDGCLIQAENNFYCVNNPVVSSPAIINSVIIGTGNIANTTNDGIRSDNHTLTIRNSAIYNCGNYGINGVAGGHFENVTFGVELDNNDYDIQSQNATSIGFDVQCGGKGTAVSAVTTLRTSTYDSTKSTSSFHNWQRTLGNNYRKINSGACRFVASGSDPGTPPSGSSIVLAFTRNEAANLVPQWDLMASDLMEWQEFLSAGSRTIRMYIQNNSFGNINTVDTKENQDFWFEIITVGQYVSSAVYRLTYDNDDQASFKRSSSSANPIPDRGDADDWNDYLEVTLTMPVDAPAIIRLHSKIYDANGILYVDPQLGIS